MTPVGFEPTQLALVELESTPLRPLGQSVLTIQQPTLNYAGNKRCEIFFGSVPTLLPEDSVTK